MVLTPLMAPQGQRACGAVDRQLSAGVSGLDADRLGGPPPEGAQGIPLHYNDERPHRSRDLHPPALLGKPITHERRHTINK